MCPFSHVCADGKWHADENGVPFSLDTFVSICLNVWKEPEYRRAACMDMHDSRQLLDPLLNVAMWLYKKLNPYVEQALYDALFLAVV
jgi:hypothetical protein